MSSDMFLLDGPLFRQTPELGTTDFDLFADPFFPFPESPPPDVNLQYTTDQLPQLCQDACVPVPHLLSSSPPSHQMRGLSLDSPAPTRGPADDGGGLLNLGGFESTSPPGVCSLDNKIALMLQRSFSSHSLDGKHGGGLLFRPRFSSLCEGASLATQASSNCGFGGPIRRSSSTGDLQRLNRVAMAQGSPSPLGQESSSPCMEEIGFKVVGRYSAEERKQRIHRYRSKRTQRNFNKTIKYACRKTLADSRPRVRGRFARNDEVGEIFKAASCHPEDEDEGENLDLFQEEEEGGGGGVFMSSSFDTSDQQQFCYYGTSILH
ncbi:hypothetical protein H6P81_005021 [Aristolochia fimbriata]|uniref:CCT domain-containing protein n=1 Tax=Aristolochia fimbriata TaxID=158543 RepID=A0AAV7EWU7_ARIFI|nr:hypothetical protein H6P81_005021 [Aristolochia fimbriata]